MHLQLRDGLFHCYCGTHPIFLDSEANRYFALPSELEEAFHKISDNACLEDIDQALVEALVSEGVLARDLSAEPAQWPQSIPSPIGDLPRMKISKPSGFLIFKAIYASLSARWLVNRCGLDGLRKVLEHLPKQGLASKKAGSAQRLAQLRSAFDLVDRLITPRDQCLPRSLAMHRLANAVGASTYIVLGVRTEPFAAHCWVEFEQGVVTGDFEQARLFTPIMRIG